MKHCRSDYNQRIQDAFGTIPKEEPVFLLRGQDRLAYQAVKLWADLAEKQPGIPSEVVERVRRHAMEMYLWSEERGKLPDCPAPLLEP